MGGAIERAMAAVRAAAPRAESDPERPVFHFRPPAGWMNDPNGTIYHDGHYELFYQFNPYGDRWDTIHWGHARSRHLVHWEHLPIALAPATDLGEVHCFSGSAFKPGGRPPMLFYTSVHGDFADHPAQQWAVACDRHMKRFTRHAANPVLAIDGHQGPRFHGDWRDPYLFAEGGRTFMILGARLERDGAPVIPIFEADDDSLVRWNYRGILHRAEPSEIEFFECPQLIRLGARHVLIYSPESQVECVVGDFDPGDCTFEPGTSARLDHSLNFYAASTFQNVPAGRHILIGWVRGWDGDATSARGLGVPGITEWQGGRGWNGVLGLPRQLTLGPDGLPRQTPVSEIEQLRRSAVREDDVVTLRAEARELQGVRGATLELQAEIEPGEASACGIRLRHAGPGGTASIRISEGGRRFEVGGIDIPTGAADRDVARVRAFFDRSLLEVYLNDGQAVCTRVLETDGAPVQVELFAAGGRATFRSVRAWPLDPAW